MTFLNSIPFSFQGFVTIGSMLAAFVVLWVALCALNAMSGKTPFIVRLAYVLIGTGAGAMILAPVYIGHKPGIGGAVLAIGVATLLLAERYRTRRAIRRFGFHRRRSDIT